MSIFKINKKELLATLNVILAISGYQLAASTLSLTGLTAVESQVITIPYRAFELSIALACVVVGILNKDGRAKSSMPIYIFFGYFALFILRIFFDLSTDVTGYAYAEGYKVYGTVVICLFCALGAFLTFKYIKFDLVVVGVALCTLFVLVLSALGFAQTVDMWTDLSTKRLSASDALFSISFAYLGIISIIAAIVLLIYKYPFLLKLIAMAIFPLALRCIYLAGSRSPVIVLIVVGIIFLASKVKNYFVFVVISVASIVSLGIMGTHMVYLFLSDKSVLGARFISMTEGDTSGRDLLFKDGISLAIKNPIFGASTINPMTDTTPLCGYHSIIPDALANFGLIFGSVFLAFVAYTGFISSLLIIRRNIRTTFISLLFITYLLYGIIAGSAYFTKEIFSVATILLLAIYNEEKNNLYAPQVYG